MTMTTIPTPEETEAELEARSTDAVSGSGDKTFGGITTTSGLIVLAIMGSVGVFLAIRSVQALDIAGWSFVTSQTWQPDAGSFGIRGVLAFTAAIAIIAVAIAVPISLFTALFITEVAPPWMRSTLVALVDLMAAVPSVVYGLWGFFLMQGHLVPLARWINTWFGWLPFFGVEGADPSNPLSTASIYSSSSFIAGVVVAMMVIPIQAAVMREVFSQVPIGEREGAYALGSTRWGMIRVVSLPYGRGGIIGGTMLGLGRALGETIAVLMLVSPRFDFTPNVLERGSNSISVLIAGRYNEASDVELSGLFAAGLVLFLITLVVNFTASYFVSRSRSGASSET